MHSKDIPGLTYDDTRLRLLISDALKAVVPVHRSEQLLSDSYAFEMLLLEHFSKAENTELNSKDAGSGIRKNGHLSFSE
jgi:hypothetical protein